jgi:hypothetical protein
MVSGRTDWNRGKNSKNRRGELEEARKQMIEKKIKR